MQISIGNLMITNFCSDSIKHQKFRFDLIRDDAIYEFVSTSIGKDLIELEESEDIELEHSYIIQDNDELVGYIYIEGISEEEGIVELRYAVHPEYRRLGFLGQSDSNRRGYGQQILEECSKYLFTFDNINTVELHIRKDNYPSLGCAKKAKYKCVSENNNEYYYVYRYSRGDTSEN